MQTLIVRNIFLEEMIYEWYISHNNNVVRVSSGCYNKQKESISYMEIRIETSKQSHDCYLHTKDTVWKFKIKVLPEKYTNL